MVAQDAWHDPQYADHGRCHPELGHDVVERVKPSCIDAVTHSSDAMTCGAAAASLLLKCLPPLLVMDYPTSE